MNILQAVTIALVLSIDAFTASFAYGSKSIKIPLRSILIITLISSATTALSLFAGTVLQNYISAGLTSKISFVILLVLGLFNILDSITKSIIRKCSQCKKELKFSFFNIRFILTLYANPEKADVDSSKILTSMEAVSLAVALSLDSLAVGFGAALADINVWAVLISTLIINTAALFFGCRIGDRVSKKIAFNLSWLGGVILIIMAFTKLR